MDPTVLFDACNHKWKPCSTIFTFLPRSFRFCWPQQTIFAFRKCLSNSHHLENAVAWPNWRQIDHHQIEFRYANWYWNSRYYFNNNFNQYVLKRNADTIRQTWKPSKTQHTNQITIGVCFVCIVDNSLVATRTINIFPTMYVYDAIILSIKAQSRSKKRKRESESKSKASHQQQYQQHINSKENEFLL